MKMVEKTETKVMRKIAKNIRIILSDDPENIVEGIALICADEEGKHERYTVAASAPEFENLCIDVPIIEQLVNELFELQFGSSDLVEIPQKEKPIEKEE